MADLALAFHWCPAVMDPMAPEELMRWWDKAHARTPEPQND